MQTEFSWCTKHVFTYKFSSLLSKGLQNNGFRKKYLIISFSFIFRKLSRTLKKQIEDPRSTHFKRDTTKLSDQIQDVIVQYTDNQWDKPNQNLGIQLQLEEV